MASERLAVSPAVLVWARQTSGHDVATAAKRLNVQPTMLSSWESGERSPTVAQVRNAAQLYGRPMAALLMPIPPDAVDATAVPDFRRLKDEQASWSPLVRRTIRNAYSQRSALIEVAEANEDLPQGTPEWLVSGSESDQQLAENLRSLLDLDMVPANVWREPGQSLNAVVAAIEALDVLVIQFGRVPLAAMRGFSLAEWPYPVIALNGSDWPRPRLFTLLHELAHLALRSGGICDLHDDDAGSQDLEQRCNTLAAAILMPPARFDEVFATVAPDGGLSLERLRVIALRFGASSEAALLRAVTLRLTTWDTYRVLKPELDEAYAEARAQQKAKQAEKDGGPSYYTIKARDLGRNYIRSVIRAFESDAISSRDLSEYLGVRFDQVGSLRAEVGI